MASYRSTSVDELIAGRRVLDRVRAAAVVVRKSRVDDGVDEREHRRIDGERQRERDDCDGSEEWALGQRANRVAESRHRCVVRSVGGMAFPGDERRHERGTAGGGGGATFRVSSSENRHAPVARTATGLRRGAAACRATVDAAGESQPRAHGERRLHALARLRLVHQRIAVRDFDWDSTSFDGEVADDARRAPRRARLGRARRGRRLAIRRVADAQRAPDAALHGRTATRSSSISPKPRRRSATRALHDRPTTGASKTASGLTFIEPSGRTSPRQIWSQGEDTTTTTGFRPTTFPMTR